MNNNDKKISGRKLKSIKINWKQTDKLSSNKMVGTINGDGLRLKIETNNRQLEIIGDGCRLTVVNNNGNIKIIGDGSRLEIITKNSGTVEYYGDGGRIILPNEPDSSLNSVNYIGDGGKVSVKKTPNQVLIVPKKFCKVIEHIGDKEIRSTTQLIKSIQVK